MVDAKEDSQPVLATETKFIQSPKGMILALEIGLCLIMIICKATSFGCYLWCPIIELVWAVIIFVIYSMKLQIQFFPWTDFFRAITASLTLFITSILCICWAISLSFGEVAGSIFGLMAAGVFGYDTFCITKQIKEMRDQGNSFNFILM
ncbi:proteolipid protein 2 [Pseudorasbora parva]|uniref:proteolipid protein 2 n=1 Tax=Pseudorasbora parva TaxID=51549 RepID=UPI00351F6654